ncbi:MAG: T9SS type A sorting domain-containing protein [Flavobacteriales bacterium]|nr:T9SS type A sorting domain-containing protein [Flavobacteriales bacterium]
MRSSVLLFALVGLGLHAQVPLYYGNMGGTAADRGTGVAIGPDNSHYFTGSFSGTADLDISGPGGSVTAVAENDAFLVKRSSSGVYQWGFSLGGSWLDEGVALVTMDDGDVVVTGRFAFSVDFDPGPGQTILTVPGGTNFGSRCFVARYTDAGALEWAGLFGGITGHCVPYDMARDAAGNLYISGAFQGSVDFDPSADQFFMHTGDNELDAFVCKLNANGEFQWAKGFSGDAQETLALSITVDDGGAIIVGGEYGSGSCDMDPGPGTVIYTAANNVKSGWATKLDTDGNYLWSVEITTTGWCGVRATMFDANGDVVLGGDFYGTCDLDPSAVVQNATPAGTPNLDGFLLKLANADGTTLQTVHYDGMANVPNTVTQLVHAADGTFYLSGKPGLTEDYDLGPGVAEMTYNNTIYVCKYDTDFNFLGLYGQYAYGLTNQADLAVDLVGNLVSTGTFNDYIDMDPGAGDQYIFTLGTYDAWFCVMGDVVLGTPSNDEQHMVVRPNPSSGSFVVELTQAAERVDMYDATGRLVASQRVLGPQFQFDRADLGSGVYQLRITRGDSWSIARVVIE